MRLFPKTTSLLTNHGSDENKVWPDSNRNFSITEISPTRHYQPSANINRHTETRRTKFISSSRHLEFQTLKDGTTHSHPINNITLKQQQHRQNYQIDRTTNLTPLSSHQRSLSMENQTPQKPNNFITPPFITGAHHIVERASRTLE